MGIKVKKELTVSKAKAQTWKVFSEYIRRRYANDQGMVPCITCGTVKHWKELQAGHFIPGRHNGVLFDVRNCHQQCYQCNVPLKSNPIKYREVMENRYGQEVIEELIAFDATNKQLKVWELVDLKDGFAQLITELKANL